MMRLRRSHLVQRLLAAMLAVCLSLCCCQARFLLHGLAAADTTAADIVGASCCDRCPGDDAPVDEPDIPVKGCQDCCIKGAIQKDATLVLPDVVAPAPPALVLDVPWTSRSIAPVRGEPRCVVEPQTLVRLHCALLV